MILKKFVQMSFGQGGRVKYFPTLYTVQGTDYLAMMVLYDVKIILSGTIRLKF